MKKYKVEIEFKPVIAFIDADEFIQDEQDAKDAACEGLNLGNVEVDTVWCQAIEVEDKPKGV